MTDVFLAPHNDDESLFGAFTILRCRPLVVICYRSVKQEAFGILSDERERETELALEELGDPEYMQGSTPDTSNDPDEPSLHDLMEFVKAELDWPRGIGDVWAPAVEEGGHEQHNIIGRLAHIHFGEHVRPYLTYRRGSLRTRGIEVEPLPGDISAKLRALACYESQIELLNTRPWFLDDTLREYLPL